jgi:hypothetical protein
VLHGLRKAREAAVSEVRYAKDKSIWVKVSPNEWRSTALGYENVTWFNFLVESQEDVKPREGIFQTRRRLSTELVPHLTQSLRSFRCRLDQLCTLFEQSQGITEDGAQDVTVEALGCVPVETQSIRECHLAYGESAVHQSGRLREYCAAMTTSLFEREVDILKLTIEYDASYRSVLQITGMTRAFLESFRGTVLGSIRSAANMVMSLGRLPCFISSCDDFPLSSSPRR